ncbi:MAG: LytTR family DNA-binding domain-containing protein [Bacteroidales bacterium]|jgi:DNA-binding LytR/AlgR family response regulator|nr:LytTR family DNA-binding domain-containing protein [Bacteroidales bacterium]
MITCIAIDDEPLALKQLVGYINKTPFLRLENSFTSAYKALEYLNDNQVDLMFVDINMPDLSGIDFVKSLTNPAKIIFTTAYREFAFEGYQVDAADYIVKPIGYSDFLKAVNKTRDRYFAVAPEPATIRNDEQFLFIKSEYKIVRIDFNNIMYIEGMRDYIRIHLENQKPIMSLMGIKKLIEHLPSEKFMQVHRSFIVNLTKITTIERNRIIFDPDVYIPVSEQYKDAFQSYLDNNFLK